MAPPRITFQGLRVLRPFLEGPDRELTGTDLMRESGLASGTVYPLLLRFEHVGILESYWEAEDPRDLKRPRRRFYKITADGSAYARDALRHLTPGSRLGEVG